MTKAVRRRAAPKAPTRAPRRRLARAAIVAAAGVLALAPIPAEWVERVFSRGWYASLQPALTSATSLVPIAILDVLLVLAVFWAGRHLWRVIRARGSRLRTTGAFFVSLVVVASLVYLLFLGLWGLNYRRPSITTRVDHSADRVTDDAVRRMADRAVASLNRLHPRAHAELDATPTLEAVRVRLAPAFMQAQRALGSNWTAAPGRPKHSVLSPFFRWASVDGMINPIGLEVLLNPDVLPVERPAVLAHEWGHLAGWARESEASFIGWLTCLAGDDAARYSGWLTLYGHLRASLPRAERPALDARLGPGPQADLTAVAERLRRGQPFVQQVSWVTYDRFLKANRVEEGVRSYDEVVSLVVGTLTDGNGRPTLR